jgi:hypothetical protein
MKEPFHQFPILHPFPPITTEHLLKVIRTWILSHLLAVCADIRNLNLQSVIWIYYPVQVCIDLKVGGGEGGTVLYFWYFWREINWKKDMLLQ